MVFIPKDRDLVPFNSRISNMAKQNEFLKTYREITVLSNCTDINSNFTYTEDVVKAIGSTDQLGHVLSLKAFLGTWEDQSTGNPAIYSISRTTKIDEYALLTGAQHSKDIHNRIDSLVQALQKQSTFKKLRIGGTRGAMGTKRFSDRVQRYANKQFATNKEYNQRPPSSNAPKKESPHAWRKPPEERKLPKHPTPSLTVNYDDMRQRQQYSDVLKGPYTTVNNNGVQMSITNTTGTISVDNNHGTHTLVPANNTAAILGKNQGNKNKVVTQSQITNMLESKEFQETLAKIVAPQVAKQVNDLITPSVKKLGAIETQVNELHTYVNDNNKWQNQQSNRQTDFQSNINNMSESMNAMGNKLDKLVGLFQTNSLEDDGNPQGKRPVDSLSPNHHAKKDKQNHQKAKFQHKINGTHKKSTNDTQTQSEGMTSTLSPLNNYSQPPERDEEMTSQESYEEVGKGQ